MSTINIDLEYITGEKTSCEVIFTPTETPWVNGSMVVVTRPRSVRTSSAGLATIDLLPGNYTVTFRGLASNVDSISIGVPDDEATYDFTTLINAGTTIPNPPVFNLPASQGEVDAGTDASKTLSPATFANAAKWETKEDAGAAQAVRDDLATVATSGSYSDLSNKPTIPTNTNQLTNGAGFITSGGAPVQSVAGRTGAVVLGAGDIVSGTFDVARIPILPSQVVQVSSGDFTDLTTEQQAAIVSGVVVTTTDGNRWVYKGADDKTDSGNYIQLADVSPEWSVIADKPAFGTAALLDVADEGDAATGAVVKGDDSRLSDGRVDQTARDAAAAAQETADSKLDPAGDGGSLTNLSPGNIAGATDAGVAMLTAADAAAQAALLGSGGKACVVAFWNGSLNGGSGGSPQGQTLYDGVRSILELPNVALDTGGDYDDTQSAFIAPRDGRYLIIGFLGFNALQADGKLTLSAVVDENGDDDAYLAVYPLWPVGMNGIINGCYIRELFAGQIVQLGVYTETGFDESTLNYGNSDRYTAMMVQEL